MTYSVSISSAAEDDLRKAFLWYKEKGVNLAKDFVRETDETIDEVQIHPLHSQVKYGNVRVRYMEKFPYGFHYQIKGSKILIISVFHTSRNPDIWEKR
ncbi:type II toxin-antitoxin system RelE/ParE family toxin [Rhodohalobacter sp. 8-1]|uniref:type II toxin-antitoxin system RelE/ParE family toxin n=1 Tax=Rhodohalobacter sp. 8-1 TaxID=3131972 RepID=UPI0030EE39F6